MCRTQCWKTTQCVYPIWFLVYFGASTRCLYLAQHSNSVSSSSCTWKSYCFLEPKNPQSFLTRKCFRNHNFHLLTEWHRMTGWWWRGHKQTMTHLNCGSGGGFFFFFFLAFDTSWNGTRCSLTRTPIAWPEQSTAQTQSSLVPCLTLTGRHWRYTSRCQCDVDFGRWYATTIFIFALRVSFDSPPSHRWPCLSPSLPPVSHSMWKAMCLHLIIPTWMKMKVSHDDNTWTPSTFE